MSERHVIVGLLAALCIAIASPPALAADPAAMLLDPTRPTGWQPPQNGDQPAASRADGLKLQGTFNVGGRRSAMISGQRVAVGDQLSGAEVVAIDRDRVILKIDGERVELASVLPGIKSPAKGQGDTQ